MTVRNSATLKSYFESGDRPTEDEFSDQVDTIFDQNLAVINAQSPTYGAKFDVQSRTDGTTTDGSAAFISAGYSFTSADIGKHIEIKGAATSGSTITGAAAAPIDSCFQEDDSAATFVDYTTEINDAATGDVLPFPASEAIGDNFYIAHKETFSGAVIDIGTSGIGGAVTWEYWDGSAWTALSGVTDDTTGFTAAPGSNDVTWTIPGDWATRELKTGVHTTKLYYVRANLTNVYSTNPVLDQGFLKGGRIRITSTAHGHGHDHVITNKGIAGTTEANGTFTIDKIDADTYDLLSSDFANTYTSGGTGHGYLITTISSVSGGTATLGANAGASISASAEFRFGTEDGAAINLALAAVDDLASGAGVVDLGTGASFVGENLVLPANDVVIRGAGMGATKIIHQTDGAGTFFYDSALPVAGDAIFKDMTIEGRWFINQTQGVDADRHINVNQRSYVRFQNIESRYGRFMGLTGVGKSGADVLDCRVLFSARDAINMTGSEGFIRVRGNTIRHCWDDAIAAHVTASEGNPPKGGIVITDNLIDDSFGIKTLGGNRLVVANNVGRRLKGYLFQNGNSAVEGLNDPLSILIADNIATDILNANNWGGGNVHAVIRLDAPAPSTGSGITAVPPGQFDTTPNTWVLPENYWDQSNLADADWPKSGGWNFRITGNIISQTLRDVDRWSDWGYGEPESLNRTFTSTGWQDFAVTGHVQGNGDAISLSTSGGFQHLRIDNNLMKGFLNGIDSPAFTGRLVGVWIDNNQFIQIRGGAITLQPSTPNSENADVWIIRNYFNLDPYVLHTNRGAAGVWTTTGNNNPYATDIRDLKGVIIEGNTFKNLYNPVRNDGDSEFAVRDNWYVGDFTGTSATNKGVRDLGSWWSVNKFLFEDSDPTSANYGEIITIPEQTSAEVATNSPVSTGSYAIGHEIRAQTPTTTFRGWVRLTWPSGHVLNTDWAAF